jgi:hypothetical protein
MARGNSKANSEFNEERRRADKEVAADNAREGMDTPVAKEFYRAAIQADRDEIQEQMNDIYDDLYAKAKESNPNITSNPFNDKERLEARDILLDQVTDDRVRDQILDGANELKTLEAKFDSLRNQDGPIVGGNADAVADSAEQIDLVLKNSSFLGEGGTEFLRNSVGFEDAKRLSSAIIGMKRRGFESSQANATAARGFASDIEDALQSLANIEKTYEDIVDNRDTGYDEREVMERAYSNANELATPHLITLRTAFDQLSAIAFRDDQMYRRILKD